MDSSNISNQVPDDVSKMVDRLNLISSKKDQMIFSMIEKNEALNLKIKVLEDELSKRLDHENLNFCKMCQRSTQKKST